ncbi:histidine phosphatase family protein [Undibacterium fentianense]|uniref:Histidine phosphatase family protein n=1 Tax=Undibacterium fentianense TaxID=2828728 RepID=A0A941IEN8_9BURK|nr:histidine phosphatase family protein [Undibacterium fentianense]MBR7799831.1 histidine phosphatase family protein [Undibacterium fentianense]
MLNIKRSHLLDFPTRCARIACQAPLLLLTYLCLFCFAAPVQAQEKKTDFVEKWIDQNQFNELKQGGFVLYLRHGTTDNSRDDAAPITDYANCETQRILNEDGRKLAVRIGVLLKRAKIPIAQVFHSPLCRARETAELAFPHMAKQLQSTLSLASSSNFTSAEKVPLQRDSRKLILSALPDDTNRVLVSHAPNLFDLIGYFVKPEGTIVVLRVIEKDHIEYVGSIPPKLLEQLAK